MNSNIIFINSKVTGGHYALKSEKSKKPFVNMMDVCKKIKLYKSDIVADIGAYVGEYALLASKSDVTKIKCFEPTPQTFEILSMNKTANMELYNYAVTGNDYEYVDLFISKGIGVTNSIAKTLHKKTKIKVKAIRYEEAVKDSSVVKIDVEGAEYQFNIVQPKLRAIILEFHPISNRDWKTDAYDIITNIKMAGFKAISEPTFKNGWSLIGCWQR